MRLSLLALTLLMTSANAQETPVSIIHLAEADGFFLAEHTAGVHLEPHPGSPTAGQRVALYASGVAGGVLAPIVLGNTLNEGVLTVLSIPAGAALGVHLVSQQYGFEGHFTGALGNAALGSAVGVGAGLLTAYLLCTSCVLGTEAYERATFAAAGVALVTPGLVAAHRRIGLNARLAPASLAAPDGQTVPGVALRIGL